MPAPSSVQARWFSYRTQTFYEIDLALPDTDALLQQWYRDFPPSQYRHYLVAGFSGRGGGHGLVARQLQSLRPRSQ
jgi:hypothetical protein